MKAPRAVSVALLVLAFWAFGNNACPASPSIVFATTTSVDNSGLLRHILPEFTKETGIEVRVVAVGTGQALAIAERGDADLALVHDPDAEQKFMAAGHGITKTEIAWNDFIIVGPSADPAHIIGGHDAVAAFKAIWTARVLFVSRGDRSGTDAKEKRLWRAASLDPTKAGGNWYREIGGGMGAALNAAAAMQAYTLSDRGTWLSFLNKRTLRVAVEGDPNLLNRYEVITLDPKGRNPITQQRAHQLPSGYPLQKDKQQSAPTQSRASARSTPRQTRSPDRDAVYVQRNASSQNHRQIRAVFRTPHAPSRWERCDRWEAAAISIAQLVIPRLGNPLRK